MKKILKTIIICTLLICIPMSVSAEETESVSEETQAISEKTEVISKDTGVATSSINQKISYTGHQQTFGDLNTKYDGDILGTTGMAKRMESIKISKGPAFEKVSGSIMYQVHGQTYGTQEWKQDGQLAGTMGEAKRLEALRIYLTGNLADEYDIYYRVHTQSYGWLDWVKGGTSADDAQWAGSIGIQKRIEALQIMLTRKGEIPTEITPENMTNKGFVNDLSAGNIVYGGHQQTYGDLKVVNGGNILGIVGESKRLEAVNVLYQSGSDQLKGGVSYCAHVQSYGWMNWADNGKNAGTTGESKRLEAIQLKLTGDVSEIYDIYYRVHAQSFGWLGWAKNGEPAGTSKMAKRIEAVQIQLVRKGNDAPKNDGNYSIVYADGYLIMGTPGKTEKQMVSDFKKVRGEKNYPSDIYASKGAKSIEDFVHIIYKEATIEGVRPEIVYAQAMLETGYLKFGGDVDPSQCNFSGLGAIGNSENGATFESVELGIRAQVQHLKAYASTSKLNQACVDERFKYVKRGSSIIVEWLGIPDNPEGKGWASSAGYGMRILTIIKRL